jgi:hypothetical protein
VIFAKDTIGYPFFEGETLPSRKTPAFIIDGVTIGGQRRFFQPELVLRYSPNAKN